MRPIRSTPDVKFPLYKFTKREYADEFFRSGRLKLGTLYGYARTEIYKDGVHDRHEGYYARAIPQSEWRKPNVPSVHLITARNNYVYCVSDVYDESLYEVFDADCCIRITSMAFLHAIDDVMSRPGPQHRKCTSALVRKVVYCSKGEYAELPRELDFAGVFKDKSFRHQHEVRALWEPFEPAPARFVHGPELLAAEVLPHESTLTSFSEERWYRELVHGYCEWLPEAFVFVSDAIPHCERYASMPG